MKKIYLAGPDVFFRDASAHFDELEALCARLGLKGMRPSDGGLSHGEGGSGTEVAQRIYDANMALIRECDGVLANLMPFRGALEPDSGTVFEVGAAVVLGKPVAGYLPRVEVNFEDKVAESCGVHPIGSRGEAPFDAKFGFMIETFQQPLNLMIARSCTLHETAEAALESLSRAFELTHPLARKAA